MSEVCKTIKVMPWSDDQGAFVEINETDFNENIHKLYETTAPVEPPPPVAAVVPVADATPGEPVAAEPEFASEEAVVLFGELDLTAEDLTAMEKTGENGTVTVADIEKYFDAKDTE